MSYSLEIHIYTHYYMCVCVYISSSLEISEDLALLDQHSHSLGTELPLGHQHSIISHMQPALLIYIICLAPVSRPDCDL